MISESRLNEILEQFEKVRIAVVGDMMLDEYLIGKVSRISPEAPVPVVNITEERFVLGGAANVLNNINSLKGNAISYGVIGNDTNGRKFTDELKSRNIDLSGIIIDETRPTIIKSRVLAQGQQLLRLDWENDSLISLDIQNKLIENFKSKIDTIDAIILSDYNKGLITEYVAKEIIKIAKENNKIVVVDPKPQNFKNYIGATSITPNRKEALDYLGLSKFSNEQDLIDKMMNAKEELELECLLLTRSEEGLSIFTDKHERVPTVAQEVFDVTGAGDTFISTFTLAAAAGATWSEAAKIGNTASGIVVSKIGTAVTTKEEIVKFYNEIMSKIDK
ncbi:MAG: D-glycero-beta-D-manno-heptose-7-phosphate kinase [Leptotrichiaceae bacterium]|nr:D-glycero-beta-D-manno-heptose-7-phosphate kinase [Leptotrichiaceae bacterium]